jgi:hypothetical protein
MYFGKERPAFLFYLGPIIMGASRNRDEDTRFSAFLMIGQVVRYIGVILRFKSGCRLQEIRGLGIERLNPFSFFWYHGVT